MTLSEKRKSRFFKIKKEGIEEEEKAPEEEEAEEEAEEPEEAEEQVKEAVGEEAAEEESKAPERLRPSLPAPRVPDSIMHVKEEIYRLKGVLKTLEDKLDRKEITAEEYEERSKKLSSILADLYEKKIKRELGI